MGVINSTICISSLWNEGFWSSIFSGKFFHIYRFFELLIPFLMYSMSSIFAFYCFSIKARSSEKFWKINFIGNCLNFILLFALIIDAKILSMNGSSYAANSMFIFALMAVIATLNLALLIYRVPNNNVDKNEILPSSETN